jgi:YVTN family beta-propeller protein
MKLVSVNVGLPREVTWRGMSITAGIYKQPLGGRIALRNLHLDGDQQANRSVHGVEYARRRTRRSESLETQTASRSRKMGAAGEGEGLNAAMPVRAPTSGQKEGIMVHWKKDRRVIAGTFALALCANVFCAEAASLLLVLNKGDNTLAIVDAATLQVKGHVPSGPDPHEVVASADGRTAYISNYNQGNGAASTISVVDLVGQKALPPIDLGALARPHGLTLAGGKLYFTAEGAKVIGRYVAATGKIDWVMGTGQNRTHMVIVSKDAKQVFTSNVASGTICVLEQLQGGRGPGGPPSGGRAGGPPPGGPGRGRGGPPAGGPDWVVTVIPVGRGAEGFDLSPDGKELWAANAQDASVSIIDVAEKKVVKTVPVPFRSANRLKFTPDGKYVLVSDLGGNDLFVLDAASRTEVKKIALGGGAAGLQMDPSGSRAFVSVGSANSVAVIDLKDLKLTQRIEAGPGPDGLAWAEVK